MPLGLLSAWFDHDMMSAPESPSLADWLQGWGTVASAVFAALAVAAAVGVLAHDRQSRRKDEADASALQARAVLVLASADWDKREIASMTFTVRNFSASVILDLTFGFRYVDPSSNIEAGVIRSDFLGPGDSSEIITASFDPLIPISRDELPSDIMPPDVVSTRLVFTDAAGRRWRRDGRDQPVRLEERDAADVIDWARRRT